MIVSDTEGGERHVSHSIVGSLRRWDPERIGPYAIIGRLGAGAMGQVFLARSTAGRLVAVKTIRVELAEEPGFRARFAREVAAARRVSGVFTASVVEADADADLPWLATAYVPAPSLSTLVRQCGPLPVPAVRWLAAGCAEALQSIHAAGLLHRDVKPSNVLVAPDGPRVIDFGVARAAERVQLTVTRGAAGTPAYMAPEQARDSAQASPASDVFSLGATLVFAAAGHPPYQGETVMDILVRLATEPPDLTGVPEELMDLIAACLERVPRDRPTDAAILTRLGQFAAEPAENGQAHSYLPDSAMALIAEYQRGPLLTVQPGTAAIGEDTASEHASGDHAGVEATDGSSNPAVGDATAGSHTALPGFNSVAAFHARQRSSRAPGSPRRSRWRRTRDGARPASRPRPLVLAGGLAVAVALVAAGAGIGISLRDPGGQSGDPGPPPTGPPPALCTTTHTAASTPQLCVSQPYGDGDTVFVVHGTGFAPGVRVTVHLSGHGVSQDRLVADEMGTFNYAIDQGHYFFSGPIPAGQYTVTVTAPGGPSASTSFIVHPPQGPPPGTPPGPPPGGQ
jgi:serine/threonine protein kinase